MKMLILALALTAGSGLCLAKGTHTTSTAPAGGSHAVSGYVKKDGTYVAPSHATNPDGTKANNYSSKGNTNPYTGKDGTKDPNATK